MMCVGGGLGWRGLVGVSACSICGLVSGKGGGGGWCRGGTAGGGRGGGGYCAVPESGHPAGLFWCCVCVLCGSCGPWLAAVSRYG